VIDEIGNRIVASIASEIETNERNRAILKPPSSLDAWEAYHRGLWHMYRFTRPENDAAQRFFERAVSLDPTFSRAHAGLSLHPLAERLPGLGGPRAGDRPRAGRRPPGHAGRRPGPRRALGAGRALWLRGLHDQSVLELAQSVDLSPNFAQGHYSLAFVQAQAAIPLPPSPRRIARAA